MNWIACKDSPPPSGWHLAYSPPIGVVLSSDRTHVTDMHGRQYYIANCGAEITHWMPLPEAPKEGK